MGIDLQLERAGAAGAKSRTGARVGGLPSGVPPAWSRTQPVAIGRIDSSVPWTDPLIQAKRKTVEKAHCTVNLLKINNNAIKFCVGHLFQSTEGDDS